MQGKLNFRIYILGCKCKNKKLASLLNVKDKKVKYLLIFFSCNFIEGEMIDVKS